MSFVNRQLYKQKPQAWGPVSSVQASIFKNAEKIGIDPAVFEAFFTAWPDNPDTFINILSEKHFTKTYGQPEYKNNSLYLTDNGNNVNNDIMVATGLRFGTPGINTTWIFNITPELTASTYARFVFGVGPTSTLKIDNSNGQMTFDVSMSSRGYRSSFSGLNFNKLNQVGISINWPVAGSACVGGYGIINGLSQSLAYLGAALTSGFVDTGWGSVRFGFGSHINYYGYTGYIHSGFKANCLFTDSQIAYLYDNPYFLLHRVAPVFYSVPGSAGDVTISSTIGALVVTGYNVGIETGVTISVNTGIITGTGFNVEVEQGTSIKTTIGEISINGLNPDIVQGTQFIVTQGMVTINSFDTTVLNGTEIDVTSKNVNITGHAVEVEQGIIITSNVESIVITGYNVSVTNELIISLNVGSVIITGYNTTVLAGTKIDLTKTEITITGLNLEIEQGTQIDVISETIIVTGLDVSVENALSINVTTGSVNVIGYPVFVYAGILVEATIGNVAITGYNPTVAQSSGIEVTTGQVTITGLDTTIECTVLIEPTTGMVIIASYDVTVTDGLVAETPITRTNVVAASNRVITNSGSSRLIVIT